MKLTRACLRCGGVVTLRYRNNDRRWCSRSCAKRDLSDAKSSERVALVLTAHATMPGVVELPLTKGQVALIDAADAEAVLRVASWQAVCRNGAWYGRSRTSLYLHQAILTPKPGVEIDHINGNSLDNRRCNLRHATRSQNRANQHRVTGASGTKGVYWHKRDQVWHAAIARQHLGYFTNKADAVAAYATAARARYGEFTNV